MRQSAARVIKKCGGPQAVAVMLELTPPSVYKWTYPKDRGGTGGLVPSDHQDNLLRKAREAGYDLCPADFFDDETIGRIGEAAA